MTSHDKNILSLNIVCKTGNGGIIIYIEASRQELGCVLMQMGKNIIYTSG